MMHLLSDLNDFVIDANDGKIGRVKDFYFDDRRWVIRYLVVEIGFDRNSHKILLSPSVVKHLNYPEKTITVDMSLSEIGSSLSIDTNFSVSQYEIDYLSYYGYSFYWDNKAAASNEAEVNSGEPATREKSDEVFIAIDSVRRMHGDRHLRSCCEIVNYHIQANDGEIGQLKTLLVDDDTWAIQCCIANTSQLDGHQVLIAPQVIKDINWGSSNVYVDMTQQQIKEAPLFNASSERTHPHGPGVYLHQGLRYVAVDTTSLN